MKKPLRGILGCALVAALASGAGCRGDSPSAEPVTTSSLAWTNRTQGAPQAPVTFDLIYPAGYGLPRVPIGASDEVRLGENDTVLAADGSPGTVTNVGDAPVIVGSRSRTGDIVSVANIVLLPHEVTASSAKSAGKVIVGRGDTVGSVVQHATLTPLARRTVTVPQLPGTPEDFEAKPGSSTLAPGSYDDVRIAPDAVVTLTAGNYVIEDFVLAPRSRIVLDTSQGTVHVFVLRQATWDGEVTGDGSRFVFSYLGRSTLALAGTFAGTALAPHASLVLGENAEDSDDEGEREAHDVFEHDRRFPTSYSGTFYGRKVAVGRGVTIRQLSTPLLIGSLAVSRTTLCMGQQTEVTLDAGEASTGAKIGINGVPGGHQFVEFAGAPGPRLVYASVVTPGGQADFASIPVTVQSCTPASGALPPVALHFWPDPIQPNQVEFMVHDYDANGSEVLPTGPATYAWTFGDGQTMTTSSPIVSHDYTASVNPMLAYNYFQASVTVTASGGSTSAQKVVPIFSVYADNRSRGILQPPSTAAPSGNNLAMTVTNYETTPLSITGSRVDLLPCAPSLAPAAQPATSLSVTLPASATSTIDIPQPQAFSADICARGIHLFGTAAAGVVYSDTYALVRENALTQHAVTDPASIAILNQASAHTADPNRFDLDELRQLVAQGVLTQLPAAVPAGAAYSGDCTDVAAGCTCDPDKSANGLALTCEPTADWVEDPGEVLNAFKGDFILHHACGDMIADLLKSVQQEYSHSMTVSKNQVEIRHSTASEDRMVATVNKSIGGGIVGGPSAPIDPDTLRFGFPGTDGTTAYSVDEMVNGYCVPAPSGDTHSNCSIGSNPGTPGWKVFGSLHPDPLRCTSDVDIVYPVVIRPPPDATQEQLQAVTPVGDQAKQITGHYRFYMYSRGDLHSTATSGPSWAVGTQESVCSLFDLESTLHAGPSDGPLPLQGTARSQAVPGLGVGPLPPDGMVLYNVDKRTAAAWELFTNLYNLVLSGAPFDPSLVNDIFGGSLDQLADSVGNQVVNCFATDGCGESSNAWHNPGPGIAVSPDDIRTTWVTPLHGGTYGYSEPAIYVSSSFRHRYAWVPTPGAARMTVNVVDGSGNPVANATVVLDSTPAGTTDSAGTLVISTVQGSHDLQAEKSLTGTGIQPTPPTPMSLSAMQALPSCSSTTATGIPSPCSVSGVLSTEITSLGTFGKVVLPQAPSCPADLWSQECLPELPDFRSTGILGVGPPAFSEICACFAPPPPLSCDVEITLDHLVTVPSSGDVTYMLTLCDTCSDAGKPTSSCTERCLTSADCVGTQVCTQGVCTSVPTIDVALSMTQEGPAVCVKGSGFTPATSKATLTLSNLPPAQGPATQLGSTQLQILPDGTLAEFEDYGWIGRALLPDPCPFGQDVTITVKDQLTGQTASFMEPVNYWCAESNIAEPTFVGDFCCDGLCP